MCRAITFQLSPQCREITGGGVNIGNSTPVRFSVVKGGAKSRVVTNSLSPQARAYARALKIEKSLSPPIPVGGGRGFK